MDYAIRDIRLADKGRERVDWAFQHMQVLKILRDRYEKNKPFKGLRIGCCLHITTETANLMVNIKKAGAQVYLCASNPLSTQDDVAAYLVKKEKISVFGKHGDSRKSYYENIKNVMKRKPHLIVDDGCDLISSFHRDDSLAGNIIGATEETTTGVIRLRSLAKNGLLKFPVIAVNDANTKHFFDNKYGTGQSTIDGILRSTNILVAGMTAVVSGYGWCGRGIAARFRGMGANVIITEVDSLRALEAVMDGYRVMPVSEAAETGDVFITSTGNTSVLTINEMKKMKSGAILGNAGHFNVEIDLAGLRSASRKRKVRECLDEYTFRNGKKIYVLGEGRLVNLACAEGHPSSVMDMSFANQFLALKHLKENRDMTPEVYRVPEDIDKKIAELKLAGMGIRIDKLTAEQKKYVNSWDMGT
ncbi:MAG: adenosylhomocysteinase [Candidatus Omnitrophica bacterium]|nr:adenosylhomocysteinase [Candidatus Omnitrophota bacterium]